MQKCTFKYGELQNFSQAKYVTHVHTLANTHTHSYVFVCIVEYIYFKVIKKEVKKKVEALNATMRSRASKLFHLEGDLKIKNSNFRGA